jgi:hypothetical protein
MGISLTVLDSGGGSLSSNIMCIACPVLPGKIAHPVLTLDGSHKAGATVGPAEAHLSFGSTIELRPGDVVELRCPRFRVNTTAVERLILVEAVVVYTGETAPAVPMAGAVGAIGVGGAVDATHLFFQTIQLNQTHTVDESVTTLGFIANGTIPAPYNISFTFGGLMLPGLLAADPYISVGIFAPSSGGGGVPRRALYADAQGNAVANVTAPAVLGEWVAFDATFMVATVRTLMNMTVRLRPGHNIPAFNRLRIKLPGFTSTTAVLRLSNLTDDAEEVGIWDPATSTVDMSVGGRPVTANTDLFFEVYGITSPTVAHTLDGVTVVETSRGGIVVTTETVATVSTPTGTTMIGGSFTDDALAIANPYVGESTGNVTVQFRATVPLDATDQIVVTFPDGFENAAGDVGTVEVFGRHIAEQNCSDFTAPCILPTTGAWDNTARTMTLTLTTAPQVPAAGMVHFAFNAGLRNPMTTTDKWALIAISVVSGASGLGGSCALHTFKTQTTIAVRFFMNNITLPDGAVGILPSTVIDSNLTVAFGISATIPEQTTLDITLNGYAAM